MKGWQRGASGKGAHSLARCSYSTNERMKTVVDAVVCYPDSAPRTKRLIPPAPESLDVSGLQLSPSAGPTLG